MDNPPTEGLVPTRLVWLHRLPTCNYSSEGWLTIGLVWLHYRVCIGAVAEWVIVVE